MSGPLTNAIRSYHVDVRQFHRMMAAGIFPDQVEVSDATYHPDRGRTWRRYAAAGIPIYLIVRLKGPDTLIEVWTGPTGRARAARNTVVVRYTHGPVSRFPSSSTAASSAS